MNLSNEITNNDLLFIGFNQDNGNIACGTTNGFVVYNVDPFKETLRRIFSNGGIGIVEMLYRCNLLAIVGGGRNPRFPTNKVMIWDDLQNRCIGELMFKSEVHAVKLRRDRIVVVLLTKVYVYRFKDLSLIDTKQTIANPKGLISLCPDPNNNVLAIPGQQKGSIQIELYSISKFTLIKAHESDLAQFALNVDGSKIASASDKGTLIRLWDCNTGALLRELRRGMDKAEIYSISFNPTSTFIACSSDKGTVHIFSLASNNANSNSSNTQTTAPQEVDESSSTNTSNNPNTTNKSMNLGILRGILPARLVPKYFDSEWSFAQIHGIEGKSICAFSSFAQSTPSNNQINLNNNKIYVVSADGIFLSCSYLEGGECIRLNSSKITNTVDSLTDTLNNTTISNADVNDINENTLS